MTDKILLNKFFYSCILAVIMLTAMYFVKKYKKSDIIVENRCVVRNFNNDEIVLPSHIIQLLYTNYYYHLSKEDSVYLEKFMNNEK